MADSNNSSNGLSRITITDKDGNVIDTIDNETGKVYKKTPFYKKEDGTWTSDPSEVVKFSLSETGAIKLTAPKVIYDLPEFKNIFDEDTLKSYSAAFRTNPSYRVPYTQRNSDGTTEETQITIPEFVDELNVALKNFAENYNVAENSRETWRTKYGDKVDNLSLTQIAMVHSSNENAKRVYIPDFIFGTDTFLSPLKNKRADDGSVDIEDFKKYYNLSKTSDGELAGIMAMIEGHLKGSDWGEDEVTFDDGTTMKNASSANEAAKAMALRNYILSKDPDAEWYESLGASAATLGLNAMEGFTRVFMNTATMAEGIVTLGQAHYIQNATEDMDNAMSNWNEQRTLVQDSTGTLATIGQIGGMVVGTVAEAWLLKKAGTGISNAYMNKLTGVASATDKAATLKALEEATSTSDAITRVLAIADNAKNISLGAKFVIATAPIVAKVAWATNIAKTFMNAHGAIDYATAFLIDTVHDAIVYDAVTLRHVMEGDSDENVKNYWLSQLEDNAKWWIGTGLARATFNVVGKTSWGKGVKAKTTQKVQGLIAKVGDTKKKIKDNIYGGDVVRYMTEKLKSLPEGSSKANRLANKIEQTLEADELRTARKALASLDLEFDGLRLTDESWAKYEEKVVRIKAIENAIDTMKYGTNQTALMMVGEIKDPSDATGRRTMYLFNDLGTSNKAARNTFTKMYEFTNKYKLDVSAGNRIADDITDYFYSKVELDVKSRILANGWEGAEKADADLKAITENIRIYGDRLPDEVKTFLDNPATLESYYKFYNALRDFQMGYGLVYTNSIMSLRGGDTGEDALDKYMPIAKRADTEPLGRYSRFDNRVRTNISEDIQSFKFGTEVGQHYRDPELVRQSALRRTAEEFNYRGYRMVALGSEDATNITRITGEQSERVMNLNKTIDNFQKVLVVDAKGYIQDFNIDATPRGKRKVIKNKEISLTKRTEAISSFSLEDTTNILHQKNVLIRGNTKLSNLVSMDNYDDWYKAQSKQVKNYLKAEYSKYGATDGQNNFNLFKKCVQDGKDTFEAGLQRAYLLGDKSFASSGLLNQIMEDIKGGKVAFEDGYIVTNHRAALRNVKKVMPDDFVTSTFDSIKKSTDRYVADVLDSDASKRAVKAIGDLSENGGELAAKYEALKYLAGDGMANVKTEIAKEAKKSLNKYKKSMSANDYNLCVDHAQEMAEEYIRAELNLTRNALRTINKDLVDNSDVFKEARQLDRQIRGYEDAIESGSSNNNIIMYTDELGRKVYAEVDPAFASLYNLRFQRVKENPSIVAKFNAATSKLFRFGTTTVNLTSQGNQLFKDGGHVMIMTGSPKMIRTNIDNLEDMLGKNVVTQWKNFDWDSYEGKQVKAVADQLGISKEAAMARREIAIGTALSPATTETTLYKNVFNKYVTNSDDLLDGMKTNLQKTVDKFDQIDDLTNGKREIYLRNRVYANVYADAIANGSTLEQARIHAQFAMNNATTNFGRSLYHMQAIADSTPYFSAAINGTKSFWRMWSLDPVGITGRIMGGLVLPTIFLTGASLGDPENRKIYKNIPEYQKNGNLFFVVDKQIVSLPIPEEMDAIVSPFRQFVEYLYDSNESDFWELMMNDALSFSPVDLTGFSAIDMDKMIQDPTIGDRLNRGFARVFSQVAPVPLKSSYMLVTGTDPYTGRSLYDPAYSYWDDTTNSVQTMDYNQNAFAKWVASLFGKDSNANLIEKVVSGTIGTTGSNFLGQVVTLIEEGPESAVGRLAIDAMDQASKPYFIEYYDKADSVWKRAVRALTAEKNKLLSSKDFQAIYSELSQTTDESKRKKLNAKGQDLIKEFQGKVIDTVKRLASEYGGTYDRKKFAATIQLLNFNSDPVYQAGTQYSSNLASELFYEGKNAAVSTMQALGVTGANDLSIFGYLVTNDEGESVMKYTSPVAIMDMKNAWLGYGDIDQANIEAKLKTDGIKTSDMWDGYYTAKAQGKSALKAYKSAWNAKVVKSLAPYISERGVDSVMKNAATRDTLDNYLFIDNLYETRAYLKKIFKNA